MNKQKIIIVILGVILLTVFIANTMLQSKPEQKLFPFYLPWDDSEETIVSLSHYLNKPAGRLIWH